MDGDLAAGFEGDVFAEVDSPDGDFVGVLEELVEVLVGDGGLSDSCITQKHGFDLLFFLFNPAVLFWLLEAVLSPLILRVASPYLEEPQPIIQYLYSLLLLIL